MTGNHKAGALRLDPKRQTKIGLDLASMSESTMMIVVVLVVSERNEIN